MILFFLLYFNPLRKKKWSRECRETAKSSLGVVSATFVCIKHQIKRLICDDLAVFTVDRGQETHVLSRNASTNLHAETPVWFKM